MIKKNKICLRDILILSFLLCFLITPRIMLYVNNVPENIYYDSTARYFPQVEQLDGSLKNYFGQTGPGYSLFLLIFKKLTGDIIKGPVMFQHIMGVASAVMLFFYLRRINLFLAFIIPIMVFCGPRGLGLEHSILRESLCSLFFILFIILASQAFKENNFKNISFNNGFLVGLVGFVLCSIRMEFIVVFMLLPFIILIVAILKIKLEKILARANIRYICGYFLPIIVVGLIYVIVPNCPKLTKASDALFGVAYFNLQPEVYYYENSSYPELLKAYQENIELVQKQTGARCTSEHSVCSMYSLMAAHYESSDKYLAEHPEIKLSRYQLLDRIHIEMMCKNPIAYVKSFFINLKNILLTKCYPDENILIIPSFSSNNKFIDSICFLFMLPDRLNPVIINKSLYYLSFLSFPIFLFGFRKIAPESMFMFIIVILQLVIIYAWLGFPTPRCSRYNIESFIYFVQMYPLALLVQSICKRRKATKFLVRK